MARLKNNGQELVRAVMVRHGDSDMEWRKTHLTLHSNGWILRKDQIRFRADRHSPARNHDWGWKRYRRAKPGASVPRTARTFEKWGFEVVHENLVVATVRK